MITQNIKHHNKQKIIWLFATGIQQKEMQNTKIFLNTICFWRLDSILRTVTRLDTGWPEICVLIPDTGKRLFPLPQHPDQLCSIPDMLTNGHYALFLQGTRICVLKLTTHLLLVLRLKMSEAIFPFQKYAIVVCKGKFYFNLLKWY
jgi:hypothetical protein